MDIASPPVSLDVLVPRARRSNLERRETAEARLLEAALNVVAKLGTERMTMAEVGEMAGYSRGLTNHHFGSKAELLTALAGAVGTWFAGQMRSRPKPRGGLPALKGLVDLYFEGVRDMTAPTRAQLMLMADCSTRDGAFAESVANFNRQTISFIEAQMRIASTVGEIPANAEAGSMALIVAAILRGLLLQRLVDPPSIDIEALRVHTWQAMLNMLNGSSSSAPMPAQP